MAKKNRGDERVHRLRLHCERYDLLDCFDFYRAKLLKKYPKMQNITFAKLAREVFSDYLLLKKADGVLCTCITCGVKHPWYSSSMHPGHFRKQGDSAFLKYVENNVRPQCGQCNVYFGGREAKYTIFMLDKFDRKYVQYLLECKDKKKVKMGDEEQDTKNRRERLLKQKYFISYMKQCLAKK